MLAVIRKVVAIAPMEGYDSIELATVGGWNVVVKKGDFQLGDFGLYFSIGAILPLTDLTRFLGETQGANGPEVKQLKTKRFRKYLSQGLLAPLSWISELQPSLSSSGSTLSEKTIDGTGVTYKIEQLYDGMDLTRALNVRKFIHAEELHLYGDGKDRVKWPDYVPKTDEPRIQNITSALADLKGRPFVITQKFDGTSTTFILINGKFKVCSRNFEMTGTSENPEIAQRDSVYWTMAKKYNIEAGMRKLGKNIAIQGETIGPKINGNRHGVRDVTFHAFNIYDIDASRYMNWDEFITIANELNIPTVTLVSCGVFETVTCASLLELADKQTYRSGSICEGIVIKTNDNLVRFSAKIISNTYLEKYKL